MPGILVAPNESQQGPKTAEDACFSSLQVLLVFVFASFTRWVLHGLHELLFYVGSQPFALGITSFTICPHALPQGDDQDPLGFHRDSLTTSRSHFHHR